ncbi:putative quinol monooxygenase [Brevundimonas sp.]|uniref:putative quinol monooxygenase n=1 Tax=Brevundimonas sp. TaxID=1871086 RepID=UPI0025CD96F8|nr:putative quinol monooxygenase [Brevundimonas sp.]
MDARRRDIVMGAAALAAGAALPASATSQERPMYGLIGKMLCAPGTRDQVVAILLEGTDAMPGCHSYVVALDPTDEAAVWITEVWDSQDSHTASLQIPAVQDAIRRARPMITGFGERFETRPVGGAGLA